MLKTVIQADVKNIFRDRSLVFILFVPIIFILLLCFLPPLYEPLLPIMSEYRTHILSFFCILTSGLYGFILSFVMLDERDQGILPVFRTLPINLKNLMFCRIALILSLAIVFNLALILISNLVPISFLKALFSAVTSAFAGPISAFLITSFAKNKIEGVTYFKVFNLLLMAPMAGMFLTSKLSLLIGVIPFYWTYAALIGHPFLSDIIVFVVGALINMLVLLASVKLYLSRV